MIATLPDRETSNCIFADTKTERQSGEDRSKLADIGADHWNEICDSFPVNGVHWRTKLRHEDCRLIVAHFVRSALRDENREFWFNQKVLSGMHGSDKREALVSYFDQSKFCTTVKKHSKGNHCKVRRLTGVQFRKSLARQHNIWMASEGDGVPCDITCNRRLATCSKLPFNDTVWQFEGDVVSVHDRGNWFQQYGKRYRDTCRELYPEQWRFLPHIEWSTAKCETTTADYDQCLNLADKSIAWGTRFSDWQGRRTDRIQEQSESFDRYELARHYMLTWGDWCVDRLRYVNRVDGRLYYPLVNQPRGLRKANMRLQFNGRMERTCEVDMSSTYYVILASELRPSECKERLVQDFFEGIFYEQLNEEAGGEYSKDDRDLLKIAVQIDCLFGKERFGHTKLFKAMGSLYPDLAAFIRDKRNRHDGTWLSKKLTNAEGKLFIDIMLPAVVSLGIPCMTIHDALIVPESVAMQVQSLCLHLATERLGFTPRMKISSQCESTSESLVQLS